MSAGWQWPAALQGVPNAEGSFFQYILSQTPHYEKKKKKKKKKLWVVFG